MLPSKCWDRQQMYLCEDSKQKRADLRHILSITSTRCVLQLQRFETCLCLPFLGLFVAQEVGQLFGWRVAMVVRVLQVQVGQVQGAEHL